MMKKRLLALLTMLIFVVSGMTVSVSASAASLTDFIEAARGQLPDDILGSQVDISANIQVKTDGGVYQDYHQDLNYAGTSADLKLKALVDMSAVRSKFQDYVRYMDVLANLVPDAQRASVYSDMYSVDIIGSFTVSIAIPDKLADRIAVDAPNVLAPPSDMYGFGIASSNVSVTDIYTEVNPATGLIERKWEADAESGCHILTITVYSKSPTSTSFTHTKVGDLMAAADAPTYAPVDKTTLYAAYDYNDYLADLTLEFTGTESLQVSFPAEEKVLKETVFGHIYGDTKFVYQEAPGAEEITISHVDYDSVQTDAGKDMLATAKPGDELHDVKKHGISTTVELRRDQVKSVIFHVNGTYLVPPANGVSISGVDFTGVVDPIYQSGDITFNPADYTTIPGKRSKYDFVGWSLTEGGTVISGETTFTDDTTNLYAIFRERETPGGGGGASKILVTFVVDGETNVVEAVSGYAPININLKEVVVPEKEGYVFDGWYSNGAYTEKLANSFSTVVSATVYGRYVKVEAPDVLDSDNHFAYVIGYPDGNVRPEANITREEVTTIFYRLLKDDVRDSIFTDANSFTDVEADRWSNKAISTMANGGYVKGYEDGSFVPGANITRAEFVTIVSRFLNGSTNEAASFSDVSGHWAESYIAAATANKWVNGYEDGTFRPDNNITRAEAMAIINRILVRYVNAEGLHADTKQWPDNKADAWYYYDVLEATNAHNYVRQDNGIYEKWESINTNNVWKDKPHYEDAE